MTLPSSLGPLAPEAATAWSTRRASSSGARAAGRNRSSTERSYASWSAWAARPASR
jgi:hypothetical protein